ncbi:hypothetical protein [Microcoleus sp. B4-C5]|uniref:hypothetical protein n=1 Tax=Microcoleus sp. B4-C5 TaxID=2818664 RepID=UPI002FD3A5A7
MAATSIHHFSDRVFTLSKTMAEMKLRSKYPDSLRQIIKNALSERLPSIEAGIKRMKERLQENVYSNPKSFVNFLPPPLSKGRVAKWGKKLTTHLGLLYC